MARAEVLTKSFCRNMFALKNRLSHQVDADGEHRRSGWMVDGGQLFPSRNDGAALACARTTPGALVSSFEPPSYLPSLTTPLRAHAAVPAAAAAHQPRPSRACRRTAAEAVRLADRAGDGQIGGSGPRGWPGGRVPRSVLRPPAVRVVAFRAMEVLCWLLEGGFTAPKALSRHPYRPRWR